MDDHFPLMKYVFIIHIACLHFQFADSGMTREHGQTSIPQISPLTAGTGRQMSTVHEDRQEDSFDAGATQERDMAPLHGGFKGFHRGKSIKRGRVMHFGQFNSDTVSADDH